MYSYLQDSGKPGRRRELLEDRPHVIESGVVQDTPQRLTRIDLRPRFDELAIFIKRDALLLHLARQDELHQGGRES